MYRYEEKLRRFLKEHRQELVDLMITICQIPAPSNLSLIHILAEAIAVLKGEGPDDLREVCLAFASQMLSLARKGSPEDCRTMAKKALNSGAALEKFRQMCICLLYTSRCV